MSDLQKYILSRKSRDEDFSNNFDEYYQLFKIGVMLKEVREAEGCYSRRVSHSLTY